MAHYHNQKAVYVSLPGSYYILKICLKKIVRSLGALILLFLLLPAYEAECAAIATAGPDWEYTGRMLDKISARWQPPKQLIGMHRLNLILSLDSDGRLLDCKVQKGSGLDALDASACAAARAASPFGHPPANVPATVHFSFWTGGLDSRVPISEEKEHYNPIFAERAVENARYANERAQAKAEAVAKSSGKQPPISAGMPAQEAVQPLTPDDRAAMAREQAKARAEAAMRGAPEPAASPEEKPSSLLSEKVAKASANEELPNAPLLPKAANVQVLEKPSLPPSDGQTLIPAEKAKPQDGKTLLASDKKMAGAAPLSKDGMAAQKGELQQEKSGITIESLDQTQPVEKGREEKSDLPAIIGTAQKDDKAPAPQQAAIPAPKQLSEAQKLKIEKYEAQITSILQKGIFIPKGPRPDSFYPTVQLKVDKRGRILTSSILHSSGDAKLDQNILRAVQPGKILPPPPPGGENVYNLTFSLIRK